MTNKERKENAKSIFVEAFWSVAKNKGIAKVKVEDIVKKSGYNRTTFYRYFKDINDLIENAQVSLLDLVTNIFHDEIYLHNYDNMVEHFHIFDKKAAFHYFLVSQYKTYFEFSTKLKKIIYDAAKGYEPFWSLDPLNKQLIIETAIGVIRSIYVFYLTHKDKKNFEEIYSQAKEYLLFGINKYVHPDKN